MDVENNDFLQFVSLAEKHKLDYLLVGGLALLLNGAIRFTRDVDMWVKPTNDNKDRLVAILLDLGYQEEELEELINRDFTEPQVLRIHEGPIDIMTQVHFRFNFDECKARANSFSTKWGNQVPFIHINDLRELKVLARRPKDLSDVIMIDEILEEQRKIKDQHRDQQP
ncbi:DUF6036 family nucleotidyltransferase [Larkinella soli]|uniref:DUF6036 family nucleotidyltransferase n=1 Tax=Larkinella soli TaxID=1770527 RepID=UPI000FFCC5AA|nr:DUF6036 family nucleotidyltransferase [Larkinella soli]